jgi:hypothetical protein
MHVGYDDLFISDHHHLVHLQSPTEEADVMTIHDDLSKTPAVINSTSTSPPQTLATKAIQPETLILLKSKGTDE